MLVYCYSRTGVKSLSWRKGLIESLWAVGFSWHLEPAATGWKLSDFLGVVEMRFSLTFDMLRFRKSLAEKSGLIMALKRLLPWSGLVSGVVIDGCCWGRVVCGYSAARCWFKRYMKICERRLCSSSTLVVGAAGFFSAFGCGRG